VWSLRIRSAHCNLPRPGRLAALNGDLQHPVAVLGFDPLRVHVNGQCDHASKISVVALAPVILSALVRLDLVAARDGQQVLLDRHVDLFRVQAGSEQIDIDSLRRSADIDRGDAPRCTARMPVDQGECPKSWPISHDRFYYTGATAVVRRWSEASGCPVGERETVSYSQADCRTYCATSDGSWPRVLDCRAPMGHNYQLSWSWRLIMDFFDRL